MKIVLMCTVDNGMQDELEFEDDATEIRVTGWRSDVSGRKFAFGMRGIDLSPLSLCTNLRTLKLSDNELEAINLTPLSHCKRLESIDLQSNLLESIDLTPLASCKKLRRLNLYNNRLNLIDLSPLASCTNLRQLYLNSNGLKTIDLSPLGACSKLKEILLEGNQFKSIDMSPLSTCVSLRVASFALPYLPKSKRRSRAYSNYYQRNSFPLASVVASCYGRGDKLNLSNLGAQSIDLTTLANCSSLHTLLLNDNQMQSINLAPLAGCSNLRTISLKNNNILSIDLSPLRTCSDLMTLDLSGNKLQTIDLSPLNSCSSLERLNLSSNILRTCYLVHLATCKSLQKLDVRNNKLQSIDLTPLFSDPTVLCDKIIAHSWLPRNNAIYQRPVRSYPWTFLHQVARAYASDYRVQQDIIFSLGLDKYGFIDRDISDFLISLSANTPNEQVIKRVTAELVDIIASIVDEGGTTVGLKLEDLLTQHSKIAKRAERIIELRKSEIEQVQIGVVDRKRDLRALWTTAYGYEMLTALGLHLMAGLKELQQVKRSFQKIGFKLKTAKDSASESKISSKLEKAIWWIAENRGKRWESMKPIEGFEASLTRIDDYFIADPSCSNCLFKGTEQCLFTEIAYSEDERPKVCQQWHQII